MGYADEILLNYLQEHTCNLLVIGAFSDRGAGGANSAGPTAHRLVQEAPISVLLVKGHRPALRKMLVCAGVEDEAVVNVAAQLANLLQKTGITPSVKVDSSAGWKMNAGNDKKYAAAYNPKTDTVALFRPASAERHVLHELMHASTLKALSKKGMAAGQMKALFAHVKKSGELKGMYGMSDVDEFVAEAFSNPKFQEALKKIAAPSVSSSIKSGWHWFVRIVRGILGMPQEQENALSQAIEIGLGVMRENMRLNEGTADVRYNAAPGKISQTDTAAFSKWFGDSKVVDADGKPLVGRELAVAMYDRGASSATVAKALGDVSVATVKRWVSSAGAQRNASEARGGTKENRSEAVRLYREGLGAFEIAKRLGVSNRGVYNWLRDAGVEIRSMSEAQSLRAAQGRQPIRGVRSIVSTKWGDVRADSVYEAARLRQRDYR